MRVQQPPRPAQVRNATSTQSAEGAAATQAPPGVQAGWVQRADGATRGQVEARNRATVERFFAAFGRGDHAALEQAYRPDAAFTDDMFTLSKRSSIMKMWRGAPPFTAFSAEVLEVRGDQVKARWVAEYQMFGRPIRNVIDSTITLDADGRIAAQHERWDRSAWMSQALPFIPKPLQPAAYAVMRPLLSWRMGG